MRGHRHSLRHWSGIMTAHPSRATALRTGFAATLALSAHSAASAQQLGLPELEARARQEGSVVIDGPPVAELRQAITDGFQKAYGIPVSYVSSGGSRSTARVRA